MAVGSVVSVRHEARLAERLQVAFVTLLAEVREFLPHRVLISPEARELPSELVKLDSTKRKHHGYGGENDRREGPRRWRHHPVEHEGCSCYGETTGDGHKRAGGDGHQQSDRNNGEPGLRRHRVGESGAPAAKVLKHVGHLRRASE